MIDRRTILAAMAGAMAAQGQPAATRYVRYRRGDQVGYGVQRVDNIFPIEGDLFGRHTVSSGAIPLGEVKLLYPWSKPLMRLPAILRTSRCFQRQLGMPQDEL